MATRLVDQFIRMQEKRLSRRGFLAKLGGVTAGLALTLVGEHALTRRSHAQSVGCCPTPRCVGCPPTIGCPTGCTVNGTPTVCCDTGYIGATETIHQCQQCILCGIPGTCWCEYDTGNSCP